MATIQDYLELIKNAIYGKDVRQAIHDGIQQCYYDGKAGATDLEARQRLDSAEVSLTSLGSRMSTAEGDIDSLEAQFTTAVSAVTTDTEVTNIRIGDDNLTYDTAGEAVRRQFYNAKEDTAAIGNAGFGIYVNEDASLYDTHGYIDVDGGGFVPHNNYTCYVIHTHRPIDVWFDFYPSFCELAVYNGELFRTATLVTCRASSRDTLPTKTSKLAVEKDMSIVVCVGDGVKFRLCHSMDIATTKLAPVVIRPVSSQQFNVCVLDSVSGEYLTHEIIHRTQNYNSVVAQDVWYANNILDDNGNIVGFGNLNFIHNLDVAGHKGHVGAGHGCCVQVFTQFFADGKPFDPTTLAKDIECKVFSIIEKVNHYLIDEAQTTNPDYAIPTLDGNGHPIVESVQYLSAEYEANNRIHVRNRLDIKYDGAKFIGCYAAMLDAPVSECPNVIINNHKYLWTKFVANGSTYTREIKDGGSETLGDYGYDGDTAIMFGNRLKYTQRIVSTNPDRVGKLNTYMWCAQSGHDWNKVYLMPCVAVRSYETIAGGNPVETFNNGDILDVDCYRTIDFFSNN